MNTPEPFQVQRLASHTDITGNMERLTREAYVADVELIRTHFRFVANQMLDPSGDPTAAVGSVDELADDGLLAILRRYSVVSTTPVHVVWAYGDFGIVVPLWLVNKYLLQEIWYPATDDVFILDPVEHWCLELHHEGQYVCMRSSMV